MISLTDIYIIINVRKRIVGISVLWKREFRENEGWRSKLYVELIGLFFPSEYKKTKKMGDVETFGVELYFYLERQIKRIWGILDVHKIGLVSEEQYIHALKKLDGSWSRDIKELVSWEMEWRSVMKLMHERTTEQCTSPPEIESNKIDENMITFEEFYTNIMELAAKIGSNNVKRCFNRWLAIVEKRIPDSVLVSPIRTGNATPKTIRNKEREQITIPKSIASSKIISLHPVLPPGNKQKYRVRVITRKDMTAIQVFQNWQKQKSPRPTKHGLMAYDNRMEYYTYGNAQGQSRKEDTETRDWGRYASSYRTHNDTRITTPSPRTRRAKRAVSELRRSHKKCHQHKRPQTVGAVRQRSPRYFLGNPERPTTSMPDRPLSPQKLPARPKIAQPEFQIDQNH